MVIVNYNGARHLERCLAALVAQSYRAFEVILVDNASTDGSADWVAAHYPQVKLVHSARNVGFAEGNNLGIRAAQGDLIATLNTDTKVEPDYLERLSAPMQQAGVGSCAPLMLEMNQREIVDAAGLRVDRLGFAWNIGAGQPASRFDRTREVFGACAGAALYRRAMLDGIGLFDGDYFGFYEDADLAWRAHNAGWKCVFVPQAKVYHVHGASFGRMSPQKLFWLGRNRWWTLAKNYPMPALLFFSPLIVLADLAALVYSTITYRSLEPLRGRIAAWRTIGRAVSRRVNGRNRGNKSTKPTFVG